MARVELPQSKLKARRRRRRLVITGILVFLLLAIAAGVVALSWAPFVRIQSIEVVGASSVGTSTVEGVARAMLAGTYWHLFPKDGALFYPKEQIEAGLRSDFPVFNSVAASVQDFKLLRIDVAERRPDALWCGASPASSSVCFLLDQDGVVYAPAADFSGSVYIRYYGALSDSAPKAFLNPDQFHSLAALVAAAAGVAKDSATSLAVEEGSTTASIQFSSGFSLMFSLADDTADVLDRFTLALSAGPFAVHPLSDFQYLDLRFGDKLYYKMK